MASIYHTEATKQVDAEYAPKLADLNSQRKAAENQYASDKQSNELARLQSIEQLQSSQANSRSSMANLLAARGIDRGEGAIMNYANLDTDHQSQIVNTNKSYQDKQDTLSSGYTKAVTEVNSKQQQIQAERLKAIYELARKLELDKLNRDKTAAEIAALKR